MKSKSKIIFLLIAMLTFTNLTGCAKVTDKASPSATKELTEEEYLDETIANLDSITAGLQGITALVKSDPEFDTKLNDYLKDVERAADNYLKIDNVPNQYAEVHKYVKRAMEDYKSAVDAYPKGKAAFNTTNIEDAMDFMQSGKDNLLKSMDEIDKLK